MYCFQAFFSPDFFFFFLHAGAVKGLSSNPATYVIATARFLFTPPHPPTHTHTHTSVPPLFLKVSSVFLFGLVFGASLVCVCV